MPLQQSFGLDNAVLVDNTARRPATFLHSTAGSTSLNAGVTSSGGSGNAQTWQVDGVTQVQYGIVLGAFFGFQQPQTSSNLFFGILNLTDFILINGATGNVTVSAGTGGIGLSTTGVVTASNMVVSDLTSGRVTFAGASGRLVDDADMTFSTDTLTIANVNVSSGASGNVRSGTYSPTRSAETNLDSNVTPSSAQWMRVRNTVTVSGRFTADPTLTATATSFELSLPIASNFGAAEDCAGVAFCGGIAGMGAAITASVANDTAVFSWISTDVTSQTWSYTYSYEII